MTDLVFTQEIELDDLDIDCECLEECDCQADISCSWCGITHTFEEPLLNAYRVGTDKNEYICKPCHSTIS